MALHVRDAAPVVGRQDGDPVTLGLWDDAWAKADRVAITVSSAEYHDALTRLGLLWTGGVCGYPAWAGFLGEVYRPTWRSDDV